MLLLGGPQGAGEGAPAHVPGQGAVVGQHQGAAGEALGQGGDSGRSGLMPWHTGFSSYVPVWPSC